MRKNYSLIIQFATAILNCSDVCRKEIIGNGQQTFDWQREDKLIDKATAVGCQIKLRTISLGAFF
jgi:hypothetical protein